MLPLNLRKKEGLIVKKEGMRAFGVLLIVTSFICVLALSSVAQDGTVDEVRQIVLTWQDDPMTTMTISWRTDLEGAVSVAYYSPEENSKLEEYEAVVAETYTFPGTAAWIHSVELTGLAPGATYWVVLETDESRSEKFSFRTAPSESADLLFIMGADAQDVRTMMPVIRETLTKAAGEDPDFFMYSGDFVNAELSDVEWDMFFDVWDETMITSDGRRIPIVPSLGNHEVVGGYGGSREGAPFYFNRFRLPEPGAYYALQYGPELTILTLDSNHTSAVDGEQLAWLERTLEEHQDSTWIFAHYHDGAWWGSEPMHAKIRVYWVPLYEQYGVDVVHSGHTHSYRKTGPLTGITAYADEIIEIVDEGLARAQADFDPDKNYAPPLQRNLISLTRGKWQDAGYSSLVEGLKEMTYMLALYVIQTGEATRQRVYDQVSSTQLHADYWAPVLAEVRSGDLTDEQTGVLYLVNGSLGASEEGPYNYTRVTVDSARKELTVVPVFYYSADGGRWEEGEGEVFTRTQR